MPNNAEFELLESCILSGQVRESDIVKMISTDPAFGEWLRARASMRQGTAIESATDDTSLIALATWLHRLAKASAAKEDSKRFKLAADIVKEAADREREERASAAQKPAAAND
jgi:hypothetical protein